MKKYILFALLFLPMTTLAAPSVIYQPTILPSNNSRELGTSTNAWLRINSDIICLTADTCRTTWPTGSGSAYPFSPNNATTSIVGFLGGMFSVGSSTIQDLHATNFTLGTLSGGLGANNGVVYAGATTTFTTGLTYNGGVVTNNWGAGVFAWPWTNSATWVSTSTIQNFTGGVMSMASSTFHNLKTTDISNAGIVYTNSIDTYTGTTLELQRDILLSNYVGPKALAINSAGIVYAAATTTFSGGLLYTNGNVADVLTAGDGITRTTNDFDCDTASSAAFGCLSSLNWTAFNNKVATGTAVTTGELSYWLSGGTLGSVATGTVSGTNGITVTASRYVIGGALAIDCTVASASAAGCLSTGFFSTFNNKVSSTSLSGSNGVTYSSATGVIGCTNASAGATGCLTAAYFSTFDNKVSSTSLSATAPLTYNSATGVFACPTCGSGGGGGVGWASTTLSTESVYSIGKGYVGIGTSTPYGLLHLSTSTAPLLTFTNHTNALNKKNWGIFMNDASGNIYFSTTTDATNSTTSQPALSILSTGGIQVSGKGTSTFASGYGIDITNGGCVALSGVCVSGLGSNNPSASVGLTAVNGAAATFMRSDAAPALSQSIAPKWTGLHTFSTAGIISNASSTIQILNADSLALRSALTVPNGGTGAVTLTGCLTGNGTGAITGNGTCATFAYPWTTESTWMATTSKLSISGGVMSMASSTFSNLNIGTSTFSGAATFSGLTATTTFRGVVDLGGAQVSQAIASSSCGAVFKVNWLNGNTISCTLGQNTEIELNATSSHPADGARYLLSFCQDGAGSRTQAWSVNTAATIRWWNGTTTISSAANSCTYLAILYRSADTKYHVVASSTGLQLK